MQTTAAVWPGQMIILPTLTNIQVVIVSMCRDTYSVYCIGFTNERFHDFSEVVTVPL